MLDWSLNKMFQDEQEMAMAHQADDVATILGDEKVKEGRTGENENL